MSLDKIKQEIGKLEAIKDYDKVVKERDELLKKTEELESTKSNLEKGLQDNVNRNADLHAKLGEEEVRIKTLEAEVQNFNTRNKELESRIGDLEQLKATTEGKTLKEGQVAFLKAKEEEVKKLAEEHFNGMKIEWEKNQKPKEVLDTACNYLKLGIGKGVWLKELSEKGVADAVIKIISNEVSSRVDREFIRRVGEESDKKALTKLNQLKNVEWPNWIRAHVQPISMELESKIVTNSLKLLEGPWPITCDKCKLQQEVEFSVEGVSQLLRDKWIYIECMDPNCRDFFGRHKIKMELGKLIYHYLAQG
ncbi:MAG: hypothetical protein ABSB40_10975 [Nitrososphaeria archaeon]|jgi:hypothetical protein